MDKEELIDRIRSGDNAVLKKLYLENREPFFAYFHKSFRLEREQIKDLFQICMFVLYDNIASGKTKQIDSKIITYLIGIGKNKAYEAVRKKQNKFTIVEDFVIDTAMDESDLVQKIELEQKIQQIDTALEDLGAPCKDIIELFYYQKLNWKEISENLNYKNAQTVKNIKYKCIQKLKAILNQYDQ